MNSNHANTTESSNADERALPESTNTASHPPKSDDSADANRVDFVAFDDRMPAEGLEGGDDREPHADGQNITSTTSKIEPKVVDGASDGEPVLDADAREPARVLSGVRSYGTADLNGESISIVPADGDMWLVEATDTDEFGPVIDWADFLELQLTGVIRAIVEPDDETLNEVVLPAYDEVQRGPVYKRLGNATKRLACVGRVGDRIVVGWDGETSFPFDAQSDSACFVVPQTEADERSAMVDRVRHDPDCAHYDCDCTVGDCDCALEDCYCAHVECVCSGEEGLTLAERGYVVDRGLDTRMAAADGVQGGKQ